MVLLILNLLFFLFNLKRSLLNLLSALVLSLRHFRIINQVFVLLNSLNLIF